jgi:carbonic anhydrase/acetyltransferase-like protein (isoleucine patch superfamily)
MREIKDWVHHSMSLKDDAVILSTGFVDGDLKIGAGARVTIHGVIAGDLFIGPGSTVVLGGAVLGSVYNEGGVLHVSTQDPPQRAGSLH